MIALAYCGRTVNAVGQEKRTHVQSFEQDRPGLCLFAAQPRYPRPHRRPHRPPSRAARDILSAGVSPSPAVPLESIEIRDGPRAPREWRSEECATATQWSDPTGGVRLRPGDASGTRSSRRGVLCSRDLSTVRLLHGCWGVIFVMERGSEVVAQLVDQNLAEQSRGPGEQQGRAFTPWTEGGRSSGFGRHSRTPRGCGAGWRAVVRGEDAWDQAMVSGPSARYAASGPVIRCRAGGCTPSAPMQAGRWA
jgi:hypothetical protein